MNPSPVSPVVLSSDSLEQKPTHSTLETCTETLEQILHHPIELPEEASGAGKIPFKAELQIFSSTFLTIFLAELGDKTQVTTLLMSAESQSPWLVFAGAGAALVLTSLLGVLLGRWLANRISPKVLELASGSMLLLIATMLFWDILHG